MASAVSAAIAVVGTLLGSALTYVFQRKSATFSFRQQLRSERMSAYSAFIVGATEFRRGQYDRWHRQPEAPGSEVASEVTTEAYNLKSAALHALAQVQLVATDPMLVDAAEKTYELTSAVPKASTSHDLHSMGDEAATALQNFIALARSDAQSAPNCRRGYGGRRMTLGTSDDDQMLKPQE
jgi:hypothetical protein